ncbi:hypothetical protein [Oceanisphaera arctica]|uniref:Lipoprotein n=1 Tax=Oceanisphaera arctica TaxID=641510 RepID=A0A2P5TMQ0_9GAMM|nr:hypothetical protein [Oceanisphaera arctica]PPL16678.1 hypothetical protein UN63_08070 [Oceanisphaera arctica]GHA20888.1 hypothetical protein GCM10007082_22110 [Oceanisphaera arctica]
MRLYPLLKVAALSLLLSGCVAPLLAMGQGQLMWALLKPMVGLDPNNSNLLEQPLIKTRMTGLLGPNYDTTVKLLRTASELQQEGPLFYLASRYDPQQGSERASLVWNSQTNQMAALLNNGEKTKVFTEPHTGKAAVWPQAMQGWLSLDDTAPALSLTPAAKAATVPLPAVTKIAPATTKADSLPAQSELLAAQEQLKAAQAKIKALETAKKTAAIPPPASAEPKATAKAALDKLSGEQAEAAMEALLSQ